MTFVSKVFYKSILHSILAMFLEYKFGRYGYPSVFLFGLGNFIGVSGMGFLEYELEKTQSKPLAFVESRFIETVFATILAHQIDPLSWNYKSPTNIFNIYKSYSKFNNIHQRIGIIFLSNVISSSIISFNNL